MIILSELAKEKNGEQRIEIQTIILTIFKNPVNLRKCLKAEVALRVLIMLIPSARFSTDFPESCVRCLF